jgi:hypothetical protein
MPVCDQLPAADKHDNKAITAHSCRFKYNTVRETDMLNGIRLTVEYTAYLALQVQRLQS